MKTLSNVVRLQKVAYQQGDACCNECVSGQLGEIDLEWGQGHFACHNLMPEALEAVRNDELDVSYEGGHWKLVLLHSQA